MFADAATPSLPWVLLLAGLVTVGAIPLGVHLGFRAPRLGINGSPAALGLDYAAVRIPTVRGRTLSGWLLPAPGARRSVILLHGWGSNAELMLPLALPLHRAGCNLLLFNARNHGSSDGDTFSSLPRFAEDLGQAITWLRAQHPEATAHISVLGHSVGAGAALLEATRNPQVRAVIAIGTFADPDELTERSLARLHLPRLVVNLTKRYVQWIIGHRFADIAPINTICRVACPVLLVHGSHDRTVPITDARRIAAAANGAPVRLYEVPDADHDSVHLVEAHAEVLVRFLDETHRASCGGSDNGAGPDSRPEQPRTDAQPWVA
ncbi:alpha/beta hydrolase [Thiohalocapsa marina]|uniref:alpha/beta hydrolase n=1 Tax=Thiohalocapsa marina TaxID=424902 RepID=UPI0036DBED8A